MSMYIARVVLLVRWLRWKEQLLVEQLRFGFLLEALR